MSALTQDESFDRTKNQRFCISQLNTVSHAGTYTNMLAPAGFEAIEIFAFLGFPARIAGRMPVLARYVSGPPRLPMSTGAYAQKRYRNTFKYRLWLSLDIEELEKLETLINDHSSAGDERIMQFRAAQAASAAMTTVVVRL